MSEALVIVDGASKAFGRTARVSQKALTLELASLFFGGRPKSHITDDTFLALDNINFEVHRGEVLGVIGHNGAGKTTLLRMLSGEYQPDKGRVEVRGRRSNLVDLTSGFSMSLTGRENIYFRGAHLGFSREFLREREQEIIDFAGIGEFVDSEMKSYSSGMLLRLGFAVSIFVEPDVLIVDEILAVGDFLFAAKCLRKMNEIKRNAAIVYVSHALEQIVKFADRALVLDRGVPVFLGDPVQAVEYYRKLEEAKDSLGASRLSREIERGVVATIPVPKIAQTVSAEVASESQGDPVESADYQPQTSDSGAALMAQMGEFIWDQEALPKVECQWCDGNGKPIPGVNSGAAIILRIAFASTRHIRRLVLGVPIWTEQGTLAATFGTHAITIVEDLPPGADHVFQLEIPALPLTKGQYPTVLAVLDGPEFLYRRPINALRILNNVSSFSWGLIDVPHKWVQSADAGTYCNNGSRK